MQAGAWRWSVALLRNSKHVFQRRYGNQVVDTFPRPVRVVENVWIPLSDGCQLAARVWLPQDAEARPVPGILEFIPYRKRDYTRLRNEPIRPRQAPRSSICMFAVQKAWRRTPAKGAFNAAP